ncbi:MAG TPA: nicotinate phosphoribosyltransferase [Armatimonadota bacterium]|nr:nicotinate phosphoribosyltransferase [Armatimonadota bacterium]
MNPIIPSILDTDHYKITMGQVVFNQFPNALVRYEFINRGKTSFPPGFDKALRAQIQMMAALRLAGEEAQWYRDAVRYLKPTYIEWLQGYRFNPDEVTITQEGGDLRVTIEGPWYRTILWEVSLLSLISELYYRLSGIEPDAEWEQRAEQKAKRMAHAGLHWIDFGSRRRFSLTVQEEVNIRMKAFPGLFLGSSNPYICKRHGLTPMGTFAHEGPMAMQSLYGPRMCSRIWMDAWVREYNGDLGIALTDTLTTPVFLRYFDMFHAKLFDGVRIDSGDPVEVAEMVLAHYDSMNIPTRSKRFVFSDSLDDERAIALHRRFSDRCMVTAGIGTFLTNDCGARPLNMVIKLVAADLGVGFHDLVKLSDDIGKHTGQTSAIELCQRDLGLVGRK